MYLIIIDHALNNPTVLTENVNGKDRAIFFKTEQEAETYLETFDNCQCAAIVKITNTFDY